MNGKAPIIFEDGHQMRDFVSVHDIVKANLLVMERSSADGKALNIGSGTAVTIQEVAAELGSALDVTVPAEISGKYRAGDIRHCFADISAAREFLGYRPSVNLKAGIEELVSWIESQQAHDTVDQAMQVLTVHGLVA